MPDASSASCLLGDFELRPHTGGEVFGHVAEYVIEGVFLDYGLTASNGSRYHL